MLTPQSPNLAAKTRKVRNLDGKARGRRSSSDPSTLPPGNGAGNDGAGSGDPSPPPSQRNSVSTRRLLLRRQQRRQSKSTNVAAPSRKSSRRKNPTQNEEVSLSRSSRRRSCDDDAEESQPPRKKRKVAKKSCSCAPGADGGCPDCLRDLESREGKDEPNEAEQNPIEAPSSEEEDDLSTTPAFEESLARAADDHQMKRLFQEKYGEVIIRFESNLERLGHNTEEKDSLANKFRAKMFERFKKLLYEDFESCRRRICCSNEVEEVDDVGDVEDGGNVIPTVGNAAAADNPYHVDVEFSEQPPSASPTSAYTSDYCAQFKITEEKLREINMCHDNGMGWLVNDTPENWNRLNNIVRAWKGEPPKTYPNKRKTSIPLRIRFLKCNHYKSIAFTSCTPHPRWDPNGVGCIKLDDDLTVQQAVGYIQRVRDATFKATGNNQAIFPTPQGIVHSQVVRKFYAEGGIYATIGRKIENLKHRARDGTYVAKVILKYMHEKGGLCLNNAKAWSEYYSGRGSNDGRMNFYTGPLFHAAGLKLLPHMLQYDIIGLARKIVDAIRAHPTYKALAPLRELQRIVFAFLQNNIRLIEEWRLRSENSPRDNLLFMHMRKLWGGPGSTCRLCDESDVPNDDIRRSVSTYHNAHIGEEGRALKQDLVDGKDPCQCNFDQLLAQYHVLENMCPEHHLGVEDLSTLSSLASGDLDDVLGSASVQTLLTFGYGYKIIFRHRVMNLVLYELSGGRCQLSNLPWKLTEVSGVDFHHLTTKKDFIDANGKVWKTKKGKRQKRMDILALPEKKWVDAMVEDFATGIVASKSRHDLLHFVYGPKKMDGLLDHLEYSLPWDESDKHIIMPRANAD